VSRPKSAAAKNIGINIDIADILGSKISVDIDIGKGDIDPALVRRKNKLARCCDHDCTSSLETPTSHTDDIVQLMM